jgi:hypothetical protein
MDEVTPDAEHESIATSLEVEQLDKNLSVFPLSVVTGASLMTRDIFQVSLQNSMVTQKGPRGVWWPGEL